MGRSYYIHKEVEVEITAEDIKRLDTGVLEVSSNEAKQDLETAVLKLREHGEIATASRIEDIIRQEF